MVWDMEMEKISLHPSTAVWLWPQHGPIHVPQNWYTSIIPLKNVGLFQSCQKQRNVHVFLQYSNIFKSCFVDLLTFFDTTSTCLIDCLLANKKNTHNMRRWTCRRPSGNCCATVQRFSFGIGNGWESHSLEGWARQVCVSKKPFDKPCPSFK